MLKYDTPGLGVKIEPQQTGPVASLDACLSAAGRARHRMHIATCLKRAQGRAQEAADPPHISSRFITPPSVYCYTGMSVSPCCWWGGTQCLVLPAHSVILMAASTVFSEILAAQMTDSGFSKPRSSALELIMVGEKRDCVQTALEYIYKRCSLSTGSPQISKQQRLSTSSNSGGSTTFRYC